jgi:Mrp family chromosome partitioning ATPase
VDGVLLVHDTEKSNKELAIEAKRILGRAKSHIMGIVFNNMKENQYYYNQYSLYNGDGRVKKGMPDFIDMRPMQISDMSSSNHNSN